MIDPLRLWATNLLAAQGVPVDLAQVIVSIMVGFVYLILIFFAVRMTIRFSAHLVERLFRQRGGNIVSEKRAATLATLLKSIVFYSVYFIAGIVALDSIFGIDTKGIIAGAGVLGLAIGFGAQSLVRDVITGFFILFEDQFAVGDYVVIGNKEGTIEEMGLRVTKVRSWKGDLFIIPNGEVKEVTNKTRGGMMAVVDVSVAYEEDIDRVIAVINDLGQEIWREAPEKFVEAPLVQGVLSLADHGVTLRVIARTVPMEQWAIEREIRRRIKVAFDREGIEIPYPRQVNLPYGVSEDGNLAAFEKAGGSAKIAVRQET